MTRPLLTAALLASLVAWAPSAQTGVAADLDVAAMSSTARQALGVTSDATARAFTEAHQAMLALRFDEAQRRFEALGRAEPDAPLGAYGLELVALGRALVTEADDDFDRFYALNDSLTALAESRDAAPGPLFAATARLHRAFAFARQERYTRAGNAFRVACGEFRDLDGPDAWFGQGICESAAGAIPRQYRWLARLFGFSGSVSSGLAKLEAAADAGGAFAVEAEMALAVTDASLNERRAGAVDRMVALSERRPSPLTDYMAGYLLLLDRRAEEAVVLLRRTEAALGDGTVALPSIDAHLGLALFRLHEFEGAAERLETYTRTFRGDAMMALSQLHAGIAYELLGDRRRAEALYRRVRASRDYDADQAAEREAERRLDEPMTEADRALILGGAAYDAGRYEEAVGLLQPVVTGRGLPAVQRAEAAYRTGRARQAQERWDDALRHFQLAIAEPGEPLAKWGPWSVYHAGEVWEARGDLDRAEGFYDRVLDNEEEFDYHKSLEQRTRTALERIRR